MGEELVGDLGVGGIVLELAGLLQVGVSEGRRDKCEDCLPFAHRRATIRGPRQESCLALDGGAGVLP
jgi:hypothetical protein